MQKQLQQPTQQQMQQMQMQCELQKKQRLSTAPAPPPPPPPPLRLPLPIAPPSSSSEVRSIEPGGKVQASQAAPQEPISPCSGSQLALSQAHPLGHNDPLSQTKSNAGVTASEAPRDCDVEGASTPTLVGSQLASSQASGAVKIESSASIVKVKKESKMEQVRGVKREIGSPPKTETQGGRGPSETPVPSNQQRVKRELDQSEPSTPPKKKRIDNRPSYGRRNHEPIIEVPFKMHAQMTNATTVGEVESPAKIFMLDQEQAVASNNRSRICAIGHDFKIVIVVVFSNPIRLKNEQYSYSYIILQMVYHASYLISDQIIHHLAKGAPCCSQWTFRWGAFFSSTSLSSSVACNVIKGNV